MEGERRDWMQRERGRMPSRAGRERATVAGSAPARLGRTAGARGTPIRGGSSGRQYENPSRPGSGIMSGLQASGSISTSAGCDTALSAACRTSAIICGA